MNQDSKAMRFQCCFLILSVLCFAGCGGGGDKLKTVSAEGTVTLDGKPVAGASIALYDESNKNHPSAGTTDEKGHFVLATGATKGAMPGKYKVTIQHFVAMDGKPIEAKEGMDANQMQMQGLAKSDIPTSYSEYTESVLTADIQDGKSNVLDFALKADGSKP